MAELDLSVQIFNNFYNAPLQIDASQWDIVNSFFRSYAATETIANNFTNFLFAISNVTGINVLTLLDNIRGKEALQVNATIAYYLNSIKSKTVLYGVAPKAIPNYYVQRNIVQ